MSTLKAVWNCMFAPKLYKIYGNGSVEVSDKPRDIHTLLQCDPPLQKVYQPLAFEKWGDQVIRCLYVIWKFGVYTSPLLVGILYQKGYLNADGLCPLTKLVASISVIIVVSYCCKGLGRYNNPTYMKFLALLEDAQWNMTPERKQQLSRYDFDFCSWPVEFDMRLIKRQAKTSKISITRPILHQNFVQYLLNLPFRVISYLAIHTFGIKLIYPGSIGVLQMVLEQSLQQGRAQLIELHRGERFKIRTVDNNFLDAMYVNKRLAGANGQTLVICCEGNAGFYEIGIMTTPLECGYSVLGWNHPGFGASTGAPYPAQEQNAIDALVQFAIHKLGYRVQNIVLFGWSIGGYTSSWAAMNYPDIKGLVVDATFDDILPLAVNHMPRWFEPIVKLAIREYVNLNIGEQLVKYPGPVLMIRRSEDEVICLREGDLSSNRGNHLLFKLFRSRYPYILEENQIQVLKHYLSVTANAQDVIFQSYSVNENVCNSLLQSYISEYSKSYPMKIGEEFNDQQRNQMTLFLAKKYIKDFKASHCVNLPAEMFHMPWDIHVEADFVFT